MSTTQPASICVSQSIVPSPPVTTLMTSTPWIVHKFGGTSLATSECYKNSAAIIQSLDTEDHPSNASITRSINANSSPSPPVRKCIVVSAMGEVKVGAGSPVRACIAKYSPDKQPVNIDKVTNFLIKCTELAAKNDSNYLTLLQSLKERHISVIKELLYIDEKNVSPSLITSQQQRLQHLLSSLESDLNDLTYILRGVWLSKCYDLEHNWWFGYGEIWSARLMCAYLNQLDEIEHGVRSSATPFAVYVDAREIITLVPHKETIPDYNISQAKLHAWLQSSIAANNASIIVCTGYIASTSTGMPTTLGRDGSDYSASIFAALLKAESVTIWTDVDGVYSANPIQVKDAVILPELSYDEASELAYFGAKVLHPKTMTPVVLHEIPIWIRNTFNPSHPGSCILSGRIIAQRETLQQQQQYTLPSPISGQSLTVAYGVKGFSEISNLVLLKVEGTGMIGVPGVCARLFSALKNAGVSVVLITQAGSEHSICLALPCAHADLGLHVITREFRDELSSGEIQTVEKSPPVSCLAIVGDGMKQRRGVAGRLFAALADNGINIMAIAQGSSERNISVIVAQNDAQKGLRAVHHAFLIPQHKAHIIGTDSCYSPLLKSNITISVIPDTAAAGANNNNTNNTTKTIGSVSDLTLDAASPSPLSSSSSNTNHDLLSVGSTASTASGFNELIKHPVIFNIGLIIGNSSISSSWSNHELHILIHKLLSTNEWLDARRHLQVHIKAVAFLSTNTMTLDDDNNNNTNNNNNNNNNNTNKLSTQDINIEGKGSLSLDWNKFQNAVQQNDSSLIGNNTYALIIDTSNTASMINKYPRWLSHGIRVIMQPYIHPSSSLLSSSSLSSSSSSSSLSLFSFLHTCSLFDLINRLTIQGDNINKIEAILPSALSFSFTCNALLNNIKQLKQSNEESKEILLYIANYLNIHIDHTNIDIANKEWDSIKTQQDAIDLYSKYMKESKEKEMKKENSIYRYVSTLNINNDSNNNNNNNSNNGSINIGLRLVHYQHIFGLLRGKQCIIAIYTQKHHIHPYIVQAPVEWELENDSVSSSNINNNNDKNSDKNDVDMKVGEYIINQFKVVVDEVTQ